MGLGEMDWKARSQLGEHQSLEKRNERGLADQSSKVRFENPLQPSPASPVIPSIRKVDAHPVRPLGNLAFDFGRSSKKQVDGLPNIGGSTIPDFPKEVEQTRKSSRLFPKPVSSSPAVSPRPSIADEDLERSRDEGFLADDEEKPLVNDHEQNYRRPPASRNTSATSTLLQPFPAHKVFARDAHPLHLPHLDSYLANNGLFAPPRFSNAEIICSEDEKELYGYNLRKSVRRDLEVCGAQLRVPIEVVLSDHQETVIRRRKVEKRDSLEENEDHELAVLTKDSSPKSPAVVNFKEEKPSASPPKRPEYGRGYSGATSSTMSTASHPKSRLDKFPPLMLLEQGSLDELKSNAVGPRKPPGGFLGFLPGVGSLLGTIVDFVIGVEGSTLAAGIFRLQLFIDFVQLTNLNLYLVKPTATVGNTTNKLLLSTLPSLFALDLVSVFGYAVIILMAWIAIVGVILLLFWRMTRKYNPNRLVEGYNSQPWLFRPFRRDNLYSRAPQSLKASASSSSSTPSWRSTPWTKFQNVMIVMSLSVLYIPLGKLAIDALVWNVDYWPLDAQSKAMKADTSQRTGDLKIWRDPLGFCYTTTMRKDEFNW